MEDTHYLHFVEHFVDSDERERSEDELASTFNAAGASTIRKGVERCHASTIVRATRRAASGLVSAMTDDYISLISPAVRTSG